MSDSFLFVVQRVRWFSRYFRILRLDDSAALTTETIGASSTVTNVFPYEAITRLQPVSSSTSDFLIETRAGPSCSQEMPAGTLATAVGDFVYESPSRTRLLCHFFERILHSCPSNPLVSSSDTSKFTVQRLRKSGAKCDYQLQIYPFGIVEKDSSSSSGRVVQVHYFYNIREIQQLGNCIHFECSGTGRIKIFLLNSSEAAILFVEITKLEALRVGLSQESIFPPDNEQRAISLQEIISKRNALTSLAAAAGAVSIFDVNKVTNRYLRNMPRQLHINESFLVEKDASGFTVMSARRINSISLLVRTWSSARELIIEFDDGSSRKYTSGARDTLIAILLDICYAVGNFRVNVAGEPSNPFRVIPRSVNDEILVSFLPGAVFGNTDSSIESRLLKRLVSYSSNIALDITDIVGTCIDINANISFPGIAPSSEFHLVKSCLSVLLRSLNSEILSCRPAAGIAGGGVNNSRSLVALIHTTCKIIPCLQGYKCFVNVEEVDSRLVLLQLFKLGDDSVSYWTLQLLLVLCRCPLAPRNSQQEFVNKQVLLTGSMIAAIMDLISALIAQDKVANAETDAESDDAASGEGGRVESSTPQAFLPNPLVAMAAAALLESIVSSRKDTSSPELCSVVLDMLAVRCDVLVHMMRSVSLLIMENAAVLMFVLLKHRPEAGVELKEMALSEGLALKHFYSGIFSPSSTQRFISRFLAATWMCCKDEQDAGKALLRRILPHGMVDLLRHPPLSESHRANIEVAEEAFYEAMYGTTNATRSKDIQTRMNFRISAVLKERHVIIPVEVKKYVAESVSETDGAVSLPTDAPQLISPAEEGRKYERASSFENYRFMFFMITQNHNLPDLIWNEQIRLELRSSLEAEIKSFEQEQRLRGNHNIAWNFQQFKVTYSTLIDEMRVGPVYIRHFLEADDTFLRAIETPSHLELFEKLFRRVLVNLHTNSRVAIVCVRCLSRLYKVCGDLVGEFDDVMLAIRMLESSQSMELQHCFFDFIQALCDDEVNLVQLLDREFVDIIIKFVSLAHLNPDQIGNMLARSAKSTLMLKDVATEAFSRRESLLSSPTPEEDELYRSEQKSWWVPDDLACPKIWLTAKPCGANPPPVSNQFGPYRVSELLQMYERKQIDDYWLLSPTLDLEDGESFDAIVDTGRWKPLNAYFQLRMQLNSHGRALYGPAEVALKGVNILSRLSVVHRATDCRGLSFYPIPQSKRVMSEPEHLSVIAQLLLCNNLSVVDAAAELLCTLVESNPSANSKLYLTGTFYFACRYSGNSFLPIAQLLSKSHLSQSYHDGGASMARDLPVALRSILHHILPAALITILDNYGPERFATVFCGNIDTPEVIWTPDLRKHVVEMIDQHLGSFPARLRQHTFSKYDYCPIARIHFPALDKEIYVDEFYIRNLCNEAKFPNWPIHNPLILLRDTIEHWRMEMAKGVVNTSVVEAKETLGLSDKFEASQLRKAYKVLARQYHPDKNPGGRDMFEKIHLAYELLSSVESKNNETNMETVLLLIETQNIIYRRYAQDVLDQKYPVYRLLLSVFTIPPLEKPPPEPNSIELLLPVSILQLLYHTCSVSPFNAKEFIKAGGIGPLYDALSYSIEHLPACIDMLSFSMKAFKAVSACPSGHRAIAELLPAFADDLRSILFLQHTLPLIVEDCLETISNCAQDPILQNAIADAGCIWIVLPLTLAYDATLQYEDYALSTSHRSSYNQGASNMHAILAIRALGRLAGVMCDELESPFNNAIASALSRLITPPLAKLLRNKHPWVLLKTLNENVETTTKIWNVHMRKELLDLINDVNAMRDPGSSSTDLERAQAFAFSALENEPCIGGVYLRVFNRSQGDCSEVESPAVFCRELLSFCAMYIPGFTSPMEHTVSPMRGLPQAYLECAIESCKVLADSLEYIGAEVASYPLGADIAFMLLDVGAKDSSVFSQVTQLLAVLCASHDFVKAVAHRVSPRPKITWRLLRALCTTDGPATAFIWAAAEHFIASPDGLLALLDCGGVVRMLCCLFGVPGYANNYQIRLASVMLICKFIAHPTKGQNAAATLSRYLPEPLVVLLRSKNSTAALRLLDDACESPELIWTSEMRLELRSHLVLLLRQVDTFENVPSNSDICVEYRCLREELTIAGVYIKLYLRQPTFRLSNPILFLEKVVEQWECAFGQVVRVVAAHASPLAKKSNANSSSEALIKTNGDSLLGLLTATICAVTCSEPSVVDHLQQWGFPTSLAEHLHEALSHGLHGKPVACVLDLLHHLVGRVEVVDSLAFAPVDLILQLTYALGVEGSLPAEASSIIELLKRIFQTRMANNLPALVAMALSCSLPQVLLNRVIAADHALLDKVKAPANIKIFAIETIKAIIAADEIASAALQDILDKNDRWTEFRDQSHMLYVTGGPETLIDPKVNAIVDQNKRHALLLADEPFSKDQVTSLSSISAKYKASEPVRDKRERESLTAFIAENTPLHLPLSSTVSPSSGIPSANSDEVRSSQTTKTSSPIKGGDRALGRSCSPIQPSMGQENVRVDYTKLTSVNRNPFDSPQAQSNPSTPRSAKDSRTSTPVASASLVSHPSYNVIRARSRSPSIAASLSPQGFVEQERQMTTEQPPETERASPGLPQDFSASPVLRAADIPNPVQLPAQSTSSPEVVAATINPSKVLSRQSMAPSVASQRSLSPTNHTVTAMNRSSILPVAQQKVHQGRGRDSLLTAFMPATVHAPSQSIGAGNTQPRQSLGTEWPNSHASRPNPPQAAPSVPTKRLFNTHIRKGAEGIGLDLVKGERGGTFVQKLKSMQGNNPASMYKPAIKSGDQIIAVNGARSIEFADVVKLIRSAAVGSNVELTLERV